MNCSNCQNPITEGEKFCGKCGVGIHTTSSDLSQISLETNGSITKTWIIFFIVAAIMLAMFVARIFNNPTPLWMENLTGTVIGLGMPLFLIIGIVSFVKSLSKFKDLSKINRRLFFIGLFIFITPIIIFLGVAIYAVIIMALSAPR